MTLNMSKIMEALGGVIALVALIGVGYGAYQGHVNPTVEAPHRSESEVWANAKMTVYPVGTPMLVNGCTVTVHRVAVSSSINDFTMATAQCDGAKVTSTEQSCGKNCHTSAIRVDKPTAPVQTSMALIQ